MGLGQAGARSQELAADLPYEWQGFKYWKHLELLSYVHQQRAGQEVEQPGLDPVLKHVMLVIIKVYHPVCMLPPCSLAVHSPHGCWSDSGS